jgi:cell wall-associated NlpC family hydrolase
VACRREANERSEMVSQLLYGECYDVLEDKGDWLHIKNQRDGYESWIDSKMHTENNPHQTFKSILALPYQVIKNAAGLEQLLPGGSLIESVDQGYLNETQIVDTAMSYLNAPYLWGGKSIWGIDCSGFVQVVYQIHGMDIQRDAYLQAEQGLNIEFNELIEAGDLAFFSKMDEKISHVGICLGDGNIIHASGKVRIDKLDHHGIFNNETKKYSHELRLIKRIKKAV